MSAWLKGRTRLLVVAVGVVAVFAMGAAAYAAIPNADGNIYACYSNSDGAVRVQNDPAKPCAKNWSPLNWAAAQPDIPVTRTYRRSHPGPANQLGGLSVMCDEGDVATGGGYRLAPGFTAITSQPINTVAAELPPSGWGLRIENTGSDFPEEVVQVWVVCQHTE